MGNLSTSDQKNVVRIGSVVVTTINNVILGSIVACRYKKARETRKGSVSSPTQKVDRKFQETSLIKLFMTYLVFSTLGCVYNVAYRFIITPSMCDYSDFLEEWLNIFLFIFFNFVFFVCVFQWFKYTLSFNVFSKVKKKKEHSNPRYLQHHKHTQCDKM